MMIVKVKHMLSFGSILNYVEHTSIYMPMTLFICPIMTNMQASLSLSQKKLFNLKMN